jgi:hypothetical protein
LLLPPDKVTQAPRLAHCRSVLDILATDAAWWDKHGSQHLMTFSI